jgi:hypothetical protein
MGHAAQEVLKDIIARHGRSLLEHRRRCEGCIRDTGLSEREINGLLAALKAGIAVRISELGSTGLTPVALSTYASRLHEDSGLDQDLARWSVDCWAHALDAKSPGEAGAEQRQQNAPELREQDVAPDQQGEQRAAPDQSREQSSEPKQVSPSASERGIRLLGYLLAIQGLAFVLGQGGINVLISLFFYALGCACILVAAGLMRQSARGRLTGIGLCVLLLFAAMGTLAVLDGAIVPVLLSLTGAVLGVFGLVALLRWRSSAKAQDVGSWSPAMTPALFVLLASLWGLWAFGVTLGGIARAIAFGYPFASPVLWLWTGLLIDLTLLWMAWAVLAHRKPHLGRLITSFLCLAGAAIGAIPLVLFPRSVSTWVAVVVAGVLAHIGAAGFVLLGRAGGAEKPLD